LNLAGPSHGRTVMEVRGPARGTADGMRFDLVERARSGDREAFGELAAAEVDRLLVIAKLVLRDPELAEDAAQEALVRAWQQLPKLRDPGRFSGWLYRILVRAAADQLGQRRRFEATVQSLTAEPSVGDAASGLADRDQVERAFRRLSLDHRAVVVLHQYLGLPLPEVAATLGIPRGTAQSRYHYALALLRASLDADARVSTSAGVLP
jgi:RNA polymerase sigma-70 factor, ECF subfamily